MSAGAMARGGFGARVRQRLGLDREGGLLLLLFRGLLVGAVAVLVLDFRDIAAATRLTTELEAGPEVLRYLPEGMPGGRLPGLLEGEEPMSFDLLAGGRLAASGTITPGTAERLAAELEKRGSYITTVLLRSPGGSVGDAVSMARLIREGGFDTEVEPAGYCASSCPLVLAGGVERRVGEGAAVGVHQVFAAEADIESAAIGMDHAQRVSADNQRLLVEMGIDPEVWIIAMETPKDQLTFLTADDLIRLRLATEILPAVPAPA